MFPSKSSNAESSEPTVFIKSIGTKSIEGMDFPNQAFAVIPISQAFDRVSNRLSTTVPPRFFAHTTPHYHCSAISLRWRRWLRSTAHRR